MDSRPPQPAAPARQASLSTEEKRHVQNDPAVKEVLALFGGEVIDMRKQPPPDDDAGQEPSGQEDPED